MSNSWWVFYYDTRNGQYVEAMGDRAVVQIDGRLSRNHAFTVAEREAFDRPWGGMRYDAYQLRRGSGILHSHPVSGVIPMTTRFKFYLTTSEGTRDVLAPDFNAGIGEILKTHRLDQVCGVSVYYPVHNPGFRAADDLVKEYKKNGKVLWNRTLPLKE
jgi:hypothetical protein